ncbi:hypothetical protein HDV00_005064 [Rhizophlyctis rosea]|nr:hypothetical protein HDV00_005064 [Rhizophlyctis rosea]
MTEVVDVETPKAIQDVQVNGGNGNRRDAKNKTLDEIDEAPFNWVTVKTIAVAGTGFVADQYNLFAVSLIKPILDALYKDQATAQATALIGAAGTLGAVIGQVLFGILGDRLGRKSMYGATMLIIIACSLGTIFAAPLLAGLSIFATFGIWQLLLGIGIGGDYPMAATISGEFASTRNRGMIMNLVFSGQGVGRVYAAIVALVFVVGLKDKIMADPTVLDSVWRIVVVFGLIPSLAALYSRLTMPESPRFQMDINGDYQAALKDTTGYLKGDTDTHEEHGPVGPLRSRVATSSDIFRYFGKWKNMKKLIGCAGTWFVNDVAVYGLGVNTSFILSTIGYGGESVLYDKIYHSILGNFFLLFFGFFPGYYVSAFTIDRLGRRTIQLLGFAMLTIIYVIIAAANKPLAASPAGSIILYILGQFFQNFGPNSTTFLLSAELFPTRFRSTAHGISAACGKIGAVIASYGISLLVKPDSIGVAPTIGILAALMFVGFVMTWFFIPETKGIRLEDIEMDNEDDE